MVGPYHSFGFHFSKRFGIRLWCSESDMYHEELHGWVLLLLSLLLISLPIFVVTVTVIAIFIVVIIDGGCYLQHCLFHISFVFPFFFQITNEVFDEIEVRVFRPKSAPVPSPVLMHFHGGGWCLGSIGLYNCCIALSTKKLVLTESYLQPRATKAQQPWKRIRKHKAYA